MQAVPVSARLKKLAKQALFRSPLGPYLGLTPRYRFNFTPTQLMYLCAAVEGTKDVDGALLEVGCFRGDTTVFLNRLLDELGSNKPYYALDTFDGFTASDVEHEVLQRGKNPIDLYEGFSVNKQAWFDRSMARNGVHRAASSV